MVLPVGGTSVVSRKTRGSSGERPQAGPTRSVDRSASNPGATAIQRPISTSSAHISGVRGGPDELPQFLTTFPQPVTRGWVSHHGEGRAPVIWLLSMNQLSPVDDISASKAMLKLAVIAKPARSRS